MQSAELKNFSKKEIHQFNHLYRLMLNSDVANAAEDNGELSTMISAWYEEDRKVGYISGN